MREVQKIILIIGWLQLERLELAGYKPEKRRQSGASFYFNTLNEKPALIHFRFRNILSIPSTSSTMESQVLVNAEKA